MLAYFLAIAVGLGSFVLFMAAFFFPEVYRKGDFIWSGVGFFYALVLWFCAGRFTGAILLGQSASVALIGWLGWQTLRLRRDVTPQGQQTSTEAIAQTGAKGWFKGKTTQSSPVALTDDDTPEPSDEEMAEPSHEAATEADREAAAETSLESKFEEQTTPDSLPAAAAEADPSEEAIASAASAPWAGQPSPETEAERASDPSESDLNETPTQAQERVSPNAANKAKGKFWQTGIFVQVGRLLRRKPKNTPSTTPPTSETSAADEFDFDEIEDGVETRESQDTIEAPALVEPPAPGGGSHSGARQSGAAHSGARV